MASRDDLWPELQWSMAQQLRSEPAQRWTVVLALFAVTSVVETFGVGHVIRFLPLYLRQLGTPQTLVPTWTGILSASIFIFGLPLVPFWGVWADRYSRKVVIARSAFVEMVVFVALGLSRNRYEVAVSLALVGFQLGNSGVMLTALRSVTPGGRLGLAVSLFGLSSPLGLALGPTLGGILVDRGVLSLHGLFLLDAALSLGTGLMLVLFYREVRPATVPAGSIIHLALRAMKLVITTPVTRVLFGIFWLVILAQQVASPFFPLLVQRLHPGRSGLPTTIGLVFGASALVGAFLSPLAGVLGDRYGFRRVLVAAALVGGVALAAVALAPNLIWLTAAAVILGAAMASASSMVFALLATTVPEDRRSSTLNLVYVPLYLAGIVGGSLGALLVRGGLNLAVLAGACFAVGAGLLALIPLRSDPADSVASHSPAAAETRAGR